MDVLIRNTDSRPLYEQIGSQIKEQIIGGALAPGDALPSIRALAKDLRISVITTKRAYDELEAEGFLIAVPGKGSYVAEKNLALVREAHLREMEAHLQSAAGLARRCGLKNEELIELLKTLLAEKE